MDGHFNQTQSIYNAAIHTNILLEYISTKLDSLGINMDATKETLQDTFIQQMKSFKTEISRDMMKFQRRVDYQLKLVSNQSNHTPSQVVLVSNNSLKMEDEYVIDTCQSVIDEIFGGNNKIKAFKTSRLKDKSSVAILDIEIINREIKLQRNKDEAHFATPNGNFVDETQNKNALKSPPPTILDNNHKTPQVNGKAPLPQRKVIITKTSTDNKMEISDSGKLEQKLEQKDLGSSGSAQEQTKISEYLTRAINKLKQRTKSRAKGIKIESSESQCQTTEEDRLTTQKEKIRAMFFSMDNDGNGIIDKDEFAGFMGKLGVKMDRKEMDLIFDIIDKDGSATISFDEYYDYFLTFVLDATENTIAESQMRKAFLAADRNGSGTICFKEFMDYATNKRSDLALSKLTSAFEQLDKEKKGEVSFQQFRTFFANTNRASMKYLLHRQSSLLRTPTDQGLENSLKGFYDDADATSVAKYLRQRWNSFVNFKRYGSQGEIVMQGKQGIVGDFVPGQYSLLDIACFNDLPPIKPKNVKIKGVRWMSSSSSEKPGKLTFPESFDGRIPIEIASNEHLAYYDCSLATGNQLKVSLLYRHGVQDFTYQNNYFDEYVTDKNAKGGAGLEKHDFAHLDCPFEDDSGYFVIGKMNDDVLCLTAFKVPTRHAVYLPPNIIHTNDYLKGTWRTMLSDEAEIDHVQLVTTSNSTTEYKHFAFKFY